MIKLHSLLSEFFTLPLVMRIGLIVVLFGGALDILFHTAPSPWVPTLEAILGSGGYWAHVVTLIGMIITIVGMLVAAYRHRMHPTDPGR